MVGALVVAGRSLAVHQRHTFCLVMAIVLLFNGLSGILLGMWTLIVLLRRSVKHLFECNSTFLHIPDGRIASSHTAGDRRFLRLLSIGFVALAAVMILVGLWLTAGTALGLWRTFSDDFSIRASGGPDQPMMALTAAIGATCTGAVWVLTVCLIRAARSLRRPIRYWFCVVMAAIICVLPPVGTALGVATLLVLGSESVKYLFDHGPDTN
jgi:hypothetical protein